jgi:phospholipid transport system substrate-binding protein
MNTEETFMRIAPGTHSLMPGARSHHRQAEVLAPAISIAAAFLLSFMVFSSAPLAADSPSSASPLAETKALVDHAIAILRDSGLSLTDKRRELRELADAPFDFTDMAHSALGYHWRTLPEEQRTAFVPVFHAFIEDAYLNKIQQYSGQDIEVINQLSDGPDYATVNTRIVGKSESPIALSFRLRHVDGTWKIYDLSVDSISITANYRTQFSRIIYNQGFDKLVADLKVKQTELAALLGKAS